MNNEIDTTILKKRRSMTGRTLAIRDKEGRSLVTLNPNVTNSHEALQITLNHFFEMQGLPYNVTIESSKFLGWRVDAAQQIPNN